MTKRFLAEEMDNEDFQRKSSLFLKHSKFPMRAELPSSLSTSTVTALSWSHPSFMSIYSVSLRRQQRCSRIRFHYITAQPPWAAASGTEIEREVEKLENPTSRKTNQNCISRKPRSRRLVDFFMVVNNVIPSSFNTQRLLLLTLN